MGSDSPLTVAENVVLKEASEIHTFLTPWRLMEVGTRAVSALKTTYHKAKNDNYASSKVLSTCCYCKDFGSAEYGVPQFCLAGRGRDKRQRGGPTAPEETSVAGGERELGANLRTSSE